MKSKKRPFDLRKANNILTLVVVGLALYVLVYPLWPELVFRWDSWTHHSPPLVAANKPTADTKSPPETIPKDNTLVIPALNMQEIIQEGPTEATLMKGVWHRPHTSDPAHGGNTVIAGHRFTYRGAAVFYNLDKVKVGDKIVIYWSGKKYQYEVSRTYIVPPTALEIEQQTPSSTLTLYTCTPLWTSKSRLVVEAKLMEQS
jgi:LPXTG-site transpeptidase (sortase) family protein